MPRLSLIRDAEVEHAIREMAFPIFDAAGLDTSALRIFIVQDKSLNAFVAGGQNLFLHTGLLIRSENAAQLMGVIAHEAGHISGGHLARRAEELQNMSEEALLTQLLAAATIALGNPQAGMAVFGAGAQVAQRSILSFTRVQERSADQAGIKFLKQLGVSPEGLLDFFKILQQQQKMYVDRPDPYVQTHPLTGERIDAMAQAVVENPNLAKDAGEKMDYWHARMRAKLAGFLDDAAQVARLNEGKTDLASRYAHAIAMHRLGKYEDSIKEINAIIAENPTDAFFIETRGQIDYENGKVKESIGDYQKALDLAPQEALIRLGLAQSLLAAGDKKSVDQAVIYLKEVTRLEPRYGMGFRLLAIAQGKAGNIGLSALALAEQALAEGDKKRAGEQARRAESMLSKDPVNLLRAKDILEQVKDKKS